MKMNNNTEYNTYTTYRFKKKIVTFINAYHCINNKSIINLEVIIFFFIFRIR